MDLATPLTYVKGVGPARAAMLEAKGLATVEDLLSYVPFRYEDRTNVKTIAQLAPGEMATVMAEVRSAGAVRIPPPQPGAVRGHLQRRIAAPCWWRSGSTARTWRTCSRPGMKVALYGKVEFDTYAGELTMLHPEFEILPGEDEDGDAALHTGRIVPDLRGRRQGHHARVAHAAPPRAGKPGPRRRTTLPEHIRERLQACPDRWERRPRDRTSRRRTPTCAC